MSSRLLKSRSLRFSSNLYAVATVSRDAVVSLCARFAEDNVQFGGRLSRRQERRYRVRRPSEAAADDHVLDRRQRNGRLRQRSFVRRPPCRQRGYYKDPVI